MGGGGVVSKVIFQKGANLFPNTLCKKCLDSCLQKKRGRGGVVCEDIKSQNALCGKILSINAIVSYNAMHNTLNDKSCIKL